jgi:LemA protein
MVNTLLPLAGGAAVVWVIWAWNALVRLANRSGEAWSQIDVQLKRRHDLIPNLVAVAEKYLEHERATLEAVTRARARAIDAASDLALRLPAENALSGTLRTFLGVVERYPDLKGVTAMRDLMEQLTTTENRIAFSRQHFNDVVREYNDRVGTFPSSLVASLGGFPRREYFSGGQD